MTTPRIENWSCVRGRVRCVADDAEHPGYRRVTLDVDGVSPVETYPAAMGSESSIDVKVLNEVSLREGEAVEMQVRSTPRGFFAHPDKVKVTGK